MSYLIRVLLPDAPGSLGKLAEAIGTVGGDIKSVDVVESFPDGTVMDDMVISLPANTMADVLISAAHMVEGVVVDSIRPFSGTVDRRGQIKMLANVAGSSSHSDKIAQLIDNIPQALTSSWAILLEDGSPVRRITASYGAPKDDGSTPELINITAAQILNPEDDEWIPESWALLDSSLAAAPLSDSGLVLIMGRVGGPDYLPSEVEHIGFLGTILSRMLRH
ncbi:MAG: amino acid-binding ACT domain protein [Corynebacterium sp.]|nr:amino acid-binding ACT domain protein [Corynebacterium sp.]